MNIATIIQARMSSSRLPNKVLKSINGKPVIEYLIENIQYQNSQIPIIVATSKKETDRKIVNYCINHGIQYYEGDLLNVASRFYEIIKIYKLDYFVRVCADSPLLDGCIIKQLVNNIKDGTDIITNVMPRTFPKGQSVEVVRCKTFNSNFHKFKSDEDFEHVTRYFYNNIKSFNIMNIKNNKDLSSVNMSIDTKQDFNRISRVIKKLESYHPKYSFNDLINFYLDK